MAGELQAQIDALLLEQGALALVELLFATGRLLYADYEAWRQGDVGSLDEVLMGRREAVREELEQAVAYARALGLVEQPTELTRTRNTSIGAGALRVSDDPRLSALIVRRYVPAQSALQMDLFFDNPVVSLVNGLARAPGICWCLCGDAWPRRCARAPMCRKRLCCTRVMRGARHRRGMKSG
jgi:hypothetical protein